MPVSSINHKGREILHVDLRDLKHKKDVLDSFDEMKEHYLKSNEIYLLFDMTKAYWDPDIMSKLKDYGKKYFNGRSKKRAVLGVTGLRKILMKGYTAATGTEVKLFDDLEKAKDYLAQ